jgi:type I restriction enzyme R subunit
MELIKQIEINIDYILEIIKKYHLGNTKDKEILSDINRAIESSVELRNKKDLIEQFIESLDISSSVDGDWIEFVEKKKLEELEKIIKDEDLNHAETYKFVEASFRD